MVHEAIVTKGIAVKKMRIMGKGRTGFGYRRSSHVTIKLSKIDFNSMIEQSRSVGQKSLWQRRLDLVNEIKAKAVGN